MTESTEHPYVDWIVAEARRPVLVDASARDRVMEAVRALEAPRQEPVGVWSRFISPRAFTASPAQIMALAAALVGVVAVPFALLTHRDGPAPGRPTAVAASPQLPTS